ncbi:MAG: hypothetical protein ABI893_12325 [Polaromonas sp.]
MLDEEKRRKVEKGRLGVPFLFRAQFLPWLDVGQTKHGCVAAAVTVGIYKALKSMQ